MLPLGTRIDDARSRFEGAWRCGEAPRLEQFVREFPEPEREVAMQALLRSEIDLRRQRGETPTLQEYSARFERYARLVESIFETAMSEAPAAAPATAPTTTCGEGPRPGVKGPVDEGRTRDLATAISTATDPQGSQQAVPASAGAESSLRDFELLSELGRGGMGVVYKAYQKSLKRIVAVKMIRAGVLADVEERRRFRMEAEAIARLNHPHIVPIYQVGEHEGCPYFSMKFIAGRTLFAQPGAFTDDPRQAAAAVAAVARAVHHAHQHGILHRDLKPANILMDDEGQPHVTDFGLAKSLAENDGLTRENVVLGTPPYMAPEQTMGTATTASDIYGLGATLYALLTGRPPFEGQSREQLLHRVRETPPEPIRRQNPRVTRDLETICLKCLEKDPKRRYASAGDLAADLEAWLAGKPIRARRVRAAERAWLWCCRNPLTAVAAALVLVACLGAAGISWQARTARQDRLFTDVQASVTELARQKRSFFSSPVRDRAKVASSVVGLCNQLGPAAQANANPALIAGALNVVGWWAANVDGNGGSVGNGPNADQIARAFSRIRWPAANEQGPAEPSEAQAAAALSPREAAISAYDRALGMIEGLNEPKAALARAQAYCGLAELEGDVTQQIRKLGMAQQVLRAAALQSAAAPEFRAELAEVAYRLAVRRRSVPRQMTAALNDCQEALDLRVALDKMPEFHDDPAFQIDLAGTSALLGQIHSLLRQPREAARAQQRAYEVYKALSTQYVMDNLSYYRYGQCCSDYAVALNSVDSSERVLELCDESIKIFTSLLERVPRCPYDMATSLKARANYLESHGRHDLAADDLQAAVRLMDGLIRSEKDPNSEKRRSYESFRDNLIANAESARQAAQAAGSAP